MLHILHVIVAYLQHFCLHELHNCVHTNRFEYLVVECFVCTLNLKFFFLIKTIVGGCLNVCC